ncbi:MAG: hypothetical protein ACRET4_07775 [Steroidobacteraceae bacterium]
MELCGCRRSSRFAVVVLSAVALAACGGGGGGGSSNQTPAATVTLTANPTSVNTGATSQLTWSSTNAQTCTASDGWAGSRATSGNETTVALSATTAFNLSCSGSGGAGQASATVTVVSAGPVTLMGQVSYERVPFGGLGNGLNYAAIGYVPLMAEVLVEALDANTQAVLASGRFTQNYQLDVPSATNVQIRVTAATTRQAPAALPHWQISVRDLDDFGQPVSAVYTFATSMFNSGAGGVHNVQIPSGWNSAGTLVGPRTAAPFAVLDTVQLGLQRVLTEVPNADFPALTIDWGANNPGGVTFFSRNGNNRRIVLAAEVNVDTDEYDSGIILHEFGHYIDDAFARSDSIGGSHTLGDRLDLRVAFGEGLATAFSAMARNNSLMRDSFGQGQQQDGFFDIESGSSVNEGWYSETSTQELLWDLFDGSSDGSDTVTLGFSPLWSVWQGAAHAATQAQTSLFTFMTALKLAQPTDASAIDTLLAGELLTGPGMDIYGSTETNNAGSADVLPVYTTIALGGSTVLRSTNAFGVGNKLSTHRFLKFTLAAPGNVKFDLTEAAGRDPDMEVYEHGVPHAPVMGPTSESFTLSLAADDYVLDIYDCDNADCNATLGPAPTDLTISVTPN